MNLSKLLMEAHEEMKEIDESREIHAIKRARERYGLFLNTQDLKEIAWKIFNGEAVRLRSLPGGAASYLVKTGGQVCHVVYDPVSRMVATFLELNQKRKGSYRRAGRQGPRVWKRRK